VIIAELAFVIQNLHSDISKVLVKNNILWQGIIQAQEEEYANVDPFPYDYFGWKNDNFNRLRNTLIKLSNLIKNTIDYVGEPSNKAEAMCRLIVGFSNYSLRYISIEDKHLILKKIAKEPIVVRNFFLGQDIDREDVVVKIVKSIDQSKSADCTYFLSGLLERVTPYTEDPKTLFQVLFEQLEDSINMFEDFIEVRKKSFQEFNNTLFKIWTNSTFSPYVSIPPGEEYNSNLVGTYNTVGDQYDYISNPPIIDYNPGKKSFLNFDNNFDFIFSGDSILAARDKGYNINSSNSEKVYEPFGLYHLFQPISVFNLKPGSIEIQMPTDEKNLMPIFYLKYIDNNADWELFKEEIGFYFDVVTTLAGGLGVVSKIKHLKNLTKFGKTLFYIESVDFTASVGGFTLDYVTKNCSDNSTWCQSLKKVLLLAQIISFGGIFLELVPVFKKSVKLLKAETPPQSFLDDVNGQNFIDNLDEFGELWTDYKNRIDTLFGQGNPLSNKLDNLENDPNWSTDDLDDFASDFFRKSDSELTLLKDEVDLVDEWKLSELPEQRKYVTHLKTRKMVRTSGYAQDHIHYGHQWPNNNGGYLLPNGKPTRVFGIHYIPSNPSPNTVRIIPGSKTTPLGNGHYTAYTERYNPDLNGIGSGGWAPKSNQKSNPQLSSLFNPIWSKNRLDDELALVFSHKIHVNKAEDPNEYFGIMSDGSICIIIYKIKDIKTGAVVNKFIGGYPL
jgi:hypothetical protein